MLLRTLPPARAALRTPAVRHASSWAERQAASAAASPSSRAAPAPSASAAQKPEAPSAARSPGDAGDIPATEWRKGFEGIGQRPFSAEVSKTLLSPLKPDDVEIKPDGLLYLPEIKYRRILNSAFGPGGWGMAPLGEADSSQGMVSREWVLICLGRFVATARGEQEYFRPSGVSTANEGAKSNALMRCCKDLGIASELWDPRFIRKFKSQYCVEVWCQGNDGKKRKLWRRKDDGPLEYPYKEVGIGSR